VTVHCSASLFSLHALMHADHFCRRFGASGCVPLDPWYRNCRWRHDEAHPQKHGCSDKEVADFLHSQRQPTYRHNQRFGRYFQLHSNLNLKLRRISTFVSDKLAVIHEGTYLVTLSGVQRCETPPSGKLLAKIETRLAFRL